jgi:hypothetical protein
VRCFFECEVDVLVWSRLLNVPSQHCACVCLATFFSRDDVVVADGPRTVNENGTNYRESKRGDSWAERLGCVAAEPALKSMEIT